MIFAIGDIVQSGAGHDLGEYYVVTAADDTFAYVSDGSRRTMDHPKKKRHKHLMKVGDCPADVRGDLLGSVLIRDERIKRVIKMWRQENVKG